MQDGLLKIFVCAAAIGAGLTTGIAFVLGAAKLLQDVISSF